MSVEVMSSLPMQATSALAHAAGRIALSGLSLYMRAPLRNSAVTALCVLSAMAGSNLLYGQAHHHPAPLFGTFAETEAATPVAKVKPATKAKALPKTSAETTGTIAPPAKTTNGLDNEDVRAVQLQLKAMNFFTGTVDGLFGPRTSKAIKAFEAQIGRPQKGQLTPEIVALIKGAQMPASPIAPRPAPTTTPVAPVETTTASLPAPAPLAPTPAPLSVATDAVPEAIAAPTATEPTPASDETTGSTGGEALAITTPATVTKRAVQTVAVRATTTLTTTDDGADGTDTQMPAPLVAATTETSADAPVAVDPPATASVAMVEAPVATTADPAMDSKVVSAVQRGLNSLGFLHGAISGEADESTAKAIRNFEVYYNYPVTGRVTQNLVKMLIAVGAVI